MVGLIGATSCKKDDENGPVNQTTFDGKAYTIKSSMVQDYGSWDGHYNYDFYLSDATVLDSQADELDGKILIYLELFSAGEERFQTGTFNFDVTGEVDGKNYFNYAELVYDSNNNSKLDEGDTWLEATAGKVTVSGTSPNYTVSYDLTFPNNKKLVGSYTGTHQIYEVGSAYPEGERSSKKRLF
ncbi:hypothetical protein ADICEAN_02232 [Cesiribacter andamanensis AMV16]|uniref:Uncharacterized protein n=2 Tax=Cesiribacter TaxID=1133570 RepID=M7N1S1_9BACT|nr:hypothetical protein ADICEAN_02232 [Cesiribacter andamanensis AMV16]